MDILGHAESPLTEEEWVALTAGVQAVAKRHLVGRRFLPLFGPLGAGVQIVQTDRMPGWDLAQVSMVGQTADVAPIERIYQPVPLLFHDFVIDWRDLEQVRHQGGLWDWTRAEAAASYVAIAEDRLILEGQQEPQLDGLLTVRGRHVLEADGWDAPGDGFHNVARAIQHATGAGYPGPYAVLVGVSTYAQWHRLWGRTEVLEVTQIEHLAGAGVYRSPLMPEDVILLIATGSENLDLAVGLDWNVAFMEATRMNYIFRVLETVSLRIKRPGAIVETRRTLPE
ncbi:MAG: family 1 encapsulin nanocompartment shell protein [Sulfobacillus sp.]|nr:family 1 encapsulin nanocompartment shell protein [Sulfobacillus sp.]